MFDLFLILYRTNRSKNKKKELEKAREKVEKIRILIRISKDLRLLNVSRFANLNLKIEEVSKQVFGWQKSLN